jgi:hypothetical protein
VPSLNAAGLLSAWETGASQPPVRRALTLLATAFPETPASEWARASIGERDRSLIALREQLFGSRIEVVARCPRCSERLEMNFETADITVARPAIGQDSLRIASGGCEIAFRLPSSNDFLELDSSRNARAELLARCVKTITRDGHEIDLASAPESAKDAVAAAMAASDPQAELYVRMECPACGHSWQTLFDIVAHLWSEVEDWAHRTLRDVHVLASAYGWREPDVLNLSAARRALYVEMALG